MDRFRNNAKTHGSAALSPERVLYFENWAVQFHNYNMAVALDRPECNISICQDFWSHENVFCFSPLKSYDIKTLFPVKPFHFRSRFEQFIFSSSQVEHKRFRATAGEPYNISVIK